MSALHGNGSSGLRARVPSSLRIMEMQTQKQGFHAGKDKNGYTVDPVETTAWMDVLEIDYQRKL
eukprot:4329306-Amphidinium_carterae.1